MSKETITVDATTTTEHARPRRRIPPFAFGVLIIAVFAGVIGVSMASGTFQTTGRTTAGGGRVVPQGESATEIKGWMAIADVAVAWEVPLPEILAEFDLPVDTPPATALKDLESDVFSVRAFRDWLAARGGSTP